MKKPKPLIETNPHLSNSKKYREALILSVASSTSIETGASVETIVRTLSGKTKQKQAKKPRGTTIQSNKA